MLPHEMARSQTAQAEAHLLGWEEETEDEEEEDKIMTLEEAIKAIRGAEPGGISHDSLEGQDIDDLLTGQIAMMGRLLDRFHGIDPYKHKGQRPRFGTPNKRSYTYKARKAAGYSYP